MDIGRHELLVDVTWANHERATVVAYDGRRMDPKAYLSRSGDRTFPDLKP
jgi:hypothetical protein